MGRLCVFVAARPREKQRTLLKCQPSETGDTVVNNGGMERKMCFHLGDFHTFTSKNVCLKSAFLFSDPHTPPSCLSGMACQVSHPVT